MPAKRTLESKMNAVYAKLTKSADTFVKTMGPDGARIYVDELQGRWRVTFRPTDEQRSISWTRAGATNAACLVVRWLWECKLSYDGTPIPPELDAVLGEQGFFELHPDALQGLRI